MEKKKKKDKWIRIEGADWSLKATAIACPGQDVSVSIKLNRKLRYSEVADAVATINECIQDWWLDSKEMDPKHFIKEVKSPYYNHDKVMSVVLLVDMNVLCRKTITGKGDASFNKIFGGELERLRDCLGLE